MNEKMVNSLADSFAECEIFLKAAVRTAIEKANTFENETSVNTKPYKHGSIHAVCVYPDRKLIKVYFHRQRKYIESEVEFDEVIVTDTDKSDYPIELPKFCIKSSLDKTEFI